MPTIDKDKNPSLFRFVTDRNLLRQYDFLEDRVKVGLENSDITIDSVVLCQLNYYAVVLLCDSAGQYRTCPVKITNSKHQPPPAAEVPKLMAEMLAYIAREWTSASASRLAAYILWRINWIQPFEEGNGRTARAASLMALCLKYSMWLPGKNIIPKQIRDNRTPYYNALHAADYHYLKTKGGIDVSEVENYLQELLAKQLQS